MSFAPLRFKSTRGGGGSALGIREALEAGLASDGGLFVPEFFSPFDADDFQREFRKEKPPSLAEIAPRILAPFFSSDSALQSALPEICKSAFNFNVPLTEIPGRPGDFFLELYHGPTSAFKDVGARFLAEVLSRTGAPSSASGSASAGVIASTEKMRTVIVATSGDTGGAVAAAFYGKPGIEVVILFPKGMVSPRQEHQLCAWGGNVRAFRVAGTFDDCQRIVKETLVAGIAGETARGAGNSSVAAGSTLNRHWLSANSINLGRILPQMTYYAWASLLRASRNGGSAPGFIVPSGNLGNSLAALWAKRLGFPIGPVVLSLNSNRGVADFLATGNFSPVRATPTAANAMDVGNPSNLERIRSLYPVFTELGADVCAHSVSDAEIENEIRTSEREWGQIVCPHTATATAARKRALPEASEWILVSTAHPAKFETIVEPWVGRTLDVPPALGALLGRPASAVDVGPTLTDFVRALGRSEEG